MRGNSAIDIALWDLFGRVDRAADRANARRLLAGRRIRTYNTCAGIAYMRKASGQHDRQLGPGRRRDDYDDLDGFLHRADELAAEFSPRASRR